MVLGAGGGPLAVEVLKAIETVCKTIRTQSNSEELSQCKQPTLKEDLIKLMEDTEDFNFSLIIVEKNNDCEGEIKRKIVQFLNSNHGILYII